MNHFKIFLYIKSSSVIPSHPVSLRLLATATGCSVCGGSLACQPWLEGAPYLPTGCELTVTSLLLFLTVFF